MVGKTINEFLPRQHLLSYLEAIMRVYNQYGRRDNIYKARIKILVHEIGAEEFARQVKAEWVHLREADTDLPAEEEARIRAFFAPPPYTNRPASDPGFAAKRLEDRDFAHWVRTNVHPHKRSGHAIANISLKPEGEPPGDATAEQMEVIAELADRYSFGEIRVTHEQNLVLPHVAQADLYAVWQRLGEHGLATPNLGLISDIIACPGLDYCALANARSIPVAQRLSKRFRDLDRQHDLGELRLKISGCINACGHHHVGHIGILGLDKKGVEYYQITLGGSSATDASIGTILGPGFAGEEVPDAIETIVNTYMSIRANADETFLDVVRRTGHTPFKEALYAPA